MSEQSAVAQPKATVVAKVTRADGTEETYISHDVTVTEIDTIEAALGALPDSSVESPEAAAERAHQANEAESARNLAANDAESDA